MKVFCWQNFLFAFHTNANKIRCRLSLYCVHIASHCNNCFLLQSYRMSSVPRGTVCIINVTTTVGKTERRGTGVDCANLEKLFNELQFRVLVYNDDSDLSADVCSIYLICFVCVREVVKKWLLLLALFPRLLAVYGPLCTVYSLIEYFILHAALHTVKFSVLGTKIF